MNELRKNSTGELIPFYDASLNAGIDSWLWTFNASVADLAALTKLKPVKSLVCVLKVKNQSSSLPSIRFIIAI